jgi:hypothetical protein
MAGQTTSRSTAWCASTEGGALCVSIGSPASCEATRPMFVSRATVSVEKPRGNAIGS